MGWHEHTTRTGRAGEAAGAAYLEGKGYEILARNYRTHDSELDIVAFDPRDRTLVCIEVKTWRRPYFPMDDLRYAIPPAKYHRLRRGLAQFIASQLQLQYDFIRIDVLLHYGEQTVHIEGEA